MPGNDVNVDVTLDTKKAEADAEGFKAKMASVFGDMGKIAGGIFMAQVGGALAGQGVEVLKNSIGLARDFNEIQSKSNTIFGEAASAINSWASTAATSFGQSKAQALDAASSFGNMFSQLGIGKQTAAEMSVKMTELASDFASFHNADITEVLNAQQAAFRGEYDALQKFVPTINAASVATEAMAMTGKTNAKALTEQEKAAATYSLMLKGAGDAQGDFQRTSDSLANQQRILSAQWQDLQVKIGQVLIPALTAIVTTINTEVIPAVRDFAVQTEAYYNENIKPAIENLKQIFQTLEPVIRPILETIGNHIKNVATVWKDTVGLILAIISGDWGKAWDQAKKIVGDVIQLVKDDFSGLLDFINGLVGLAGQAGSALGGAIAGGISSGFDWIVGHVTGLINTLIRAYNNTLGKVPGAPNISEIGGGGGSSQGYDPNDPTGSHVGGGGSWEAGIEGQSAGGAGGGAMGGAATAGVAPWYVGGGQYYKAPDSNLPVGSYVPGLGYKTENGWEQTLGAAASINQSYASGQYGSGVAVDPVVVVNIGTVHASTKEDAAQAGGDIAYAIRARGGMLPA